MKLLVKTLQHQIDHICQVQNPKEFQQTSSLLDKKNSNEKDTLHCDVGFLLQDDVATTVLLDESTADRTTLLVVFAIFFYFCGENIFFF